MPPAVELEHALLQCANALAPIPGRTSPDAAAPAEQSRIRTNMKKSLRIERILTVLILGIYACDAPGAPTREARDRASKEIAPPVVPRRALVLSPEAEALGLPAVEGREISAEQEQLIQQLERLYAGTPRGREIRRSLTDPRIGHMDVRGNPAAQALVDQIESLRESQANRAFAARARQPQVVPVTVAMPDHFPIADTTIQAAILRRPNQQPTDIVILRAKDVNVVTLGSALRRLNVDRQRNGAVPTRTEILTVRADSMPDSWNRTGLRDQAHKDLLALVRSSPSDVPGIGRARTMTIALQALPAPR